MKDSCLSRFCASWASWENRLLLLLPHISCQMYSFGRFSWISCNVWASSHTLQNACLHIVIYGPFFNVSHLFFNESLPNKNFFKLPNGIQLPSDPSESYHAIIIKLFDPFKKSIFLLHSKGSLGQFHSCFI